VTQVGELVLLSVQAPVKAASTIWIIVELQAVGAPPLWKPVSVTT